MPTIRCDAHLTALQPPPCPVCEALRARAKREAAAMWAGAVINLSTRRRGGAA